MSIMYFCVVLLITVTWHQSTSVAEESGEENVRTLTSENLSGFIQASGVRVVYFHTKDAPQLKRFYSEYEKSAEILKEYSVALGKINCQQDVPPKECEEADALDNVHIYRDGVELLSLGLDNMFDVNSIVSNVLQVVMLKHMPIIQSVAEREDLIAHHYEKRHVILSYQKAIGTYEHRVLLELAHTYQEMYAFALTTEVDAITDLVNFDETEVSGVWVFYCGDENKDPQVKKYMTTKYMEALDMANLSRLMANLNLPPFTEITSDDQINIYTTSGMHCIFVFYDKDTELDIISEVDNFVQRVRGLAGIVVINAELVDSTKYGLSAKQKIPTLAVQRRGHTQVFMPDDGIPEEFIWDQLNSVLRGSQHGHDYDGLASSKVDDSKIQEEMSTYEAHYDEEVEKQDDRVAETLAKVASRPPDTKHITKLTATTFSTTETSQILFVLFYLTFDTRSMALLRVYSEASHILARGDEYPLASMDCFDWTDVCGKHQINMYPTVMVYRKGREPVTYTGMLGTNAIISAFKMYQTGTPVKLPTSSLANQFADGDYPAGMAQWTSTSVIGLYNVGDMKGISAFTSAAEQAEGKLLHGLATADTASTMASKYGAKVPCIIVVKRDDPLEPFKHTAARDVMAEEITTFTSIARLPVFPELTPAIFPAYHNQDRPMLILFHRERDTALHKAVSALALSTEAPSIIYSYMMVLNASDISGKILHDYKASAMLPTLALVSHKEGTVHLLDGDVDEDQMKTWLNNSMTGERQPDKYLKSGKWKPRNPGYDFLKFIDEEANERAGGVKDTMAHEDHQYEEEEEMKAEEMHHEQTHYIPVDDMKSDGMTESEEASSERSSQGRMSQNSPHVEL